MTNATELQKMAAVLGAWAVLALEFPEGTLLPPALAVFKDASRAGFKLLTPFEGAHWDDLFSRELAKVCGA